MGQCDAMPRFNAPRGAPQVYEGLYSIATRNFKRAAELLLDSLSTFTTTELFSYKKFIFYTVLTAIIALDRVTLRKQVLHAPEILTVLSDIPNLGKLLNGLYSCKYGDYMDAFQHLSAVVNADMFLHRHYRYILREGRVVAYSQVGPAETPHAVAGPTPRAASQPRPSPPVRWRNAHPPRSSLSTRFRSSSSRTSRSRSTAWRLRSASPRTSSTGRCPPSSPRGASTARSTRHAARCVSPCDVCAPPLHVLPSADALLCDPCPQVARLLETNRPNVKNALYLQTIKSGDHVLNRLQRLGRIVDL